MAEMVDFVQDANTFLIQTQDKWRQSASLKLRPNSRLKKLTLEMFGPPPPSRNLNTFGRSNSTLDPKPKPVNKRVVRQDEQFGEWTQFTTDYTGFEHENWGITQWCKHCSNNEGATLSGRHPKSRCSLIRNTEDFNHQALTAYLRALKAKHAGPRKQSLSAGVSTVKWNHGNPRSFSSSNITSQNERKSSFTGLPFSTMKSGYPQLLSASQQPVVPHIPCKNFNQLHKHKSFQDLQECNRTARLHGVKNESWPPAKLKPQRSDAVQEVAEIQCRNSETESEEEERSENPIAADEFEDRRDSSHDEVAVPYPQSQLCKPINTPVNTASRLSHVVSDGKNYEEQMKLLRSKSRNSTTKTKSKESSPVSSNETESNTNNTTQTNDLDSDISTTFPATVANMQEPSTNNKTSTNDVQLPNRSFQVKPKTMQEYVETYYMPSVSSSHSRSLPSITERSQTKLVESILNYRHIISSRDKSEHGRSRFMQLTAPDIRRATVQLLKTSVQHKTYNSEQPMVSSSIKSEEPLDKTESLPASLTQLTSLLRTNSANKPRRVTPHKKILHETSIPDIGVAWKIPR